MVPEEADAEDQLGLPGRRAQSAHTSRQSTRAGEAAIPAHRGLTWERQVKTLKRSKARSR